MKERLDITLILAASGSDPLRKNDPFMPLSLAILAGAAPEHNYTFVDLLWEDHIDYDSPADLVGISFRYTAENMTYEIADEFRRRGITVVLGGPQPSMVPRRAKTHADSVVVGEAEETWPLLLDDFRRGELMDYYVSGPLRFDTDPSRIRHVSRRPDLSRIPLPRREYYKKKYVFDTVYAVRGCPINCDFCSVTEIFGAGYRFRPVEEVVREIDSFRNYFYLLDDTVFGRKDTYDYYLELYERISRLKKRRFWTGQANLDAATDARGRQVITAAARAGLMYAAVGMESINESTLRDSGAIGKTGENQDHDVLGSMKQSIAFLQDSGILLSGWFVIGYDSDTIADYRRTWEFCKATNVIPVIFPVKALPGTVLYNRLSRTGRIDDSKSINVVHDRIDDRKVFPELKTIYGEAFSNREILKRTLFYLRKFKNEKIHRTIFSLVLQKKLKGGIDVSSDEFYPGSDA